MGSSVNWAIPPPDAPRAPALPPLERLDHRGAVRLHTKRAEAGDPIMWLLTNRSDRDAHVADIVAGETDDVMAFRALPSIFLALPIAISGDQDLTVCLAAESLEDVRSQLPDGLLRLSLPYVATASAIAVGEILEVWL